MATKFLTYLHPNKVLLYSILLLITIGTLLLSIPSLCTAHLPLIDALFTATSIVSATGLLTMPFEQFNFATQLTLIILMQIGSIGLVTMGLFLISLFIDLDFPAEPVTHTSAHASSYSQIKKIVRCVMYVTAVSELLGALYFTLYLSHFFPLRTALWMGTVQAVSAFCSTGITIIPTSLFEHNYLLIPTMLLSFAGGFGFISWYEFMQYIRHKINNKKYSFSLFTHIVFYATITLTICTTLIFFVLERNNAFANLSTYNAWIHALFYSIDSKSTGFINNFPHILQPPTLVITALNSLIGSSPLSTGSGMKITTFILFLYSIKETITGNNIVVINKKTLNNQQIRKANAIIALYFFWIFLATFYLLLIQSTNLHNILLIVTTAVTNLGFSNEYTITALSNLEKIILILTMIIGKIGPVSFIIATKVPHAKTPKIAYPEEKILIG